MFLFYDLPKHKKQNDTNKAKHLKNHKISGQATWSHTEQSVDPHDQDLKSDLKKKKLLHLQKSCFDHP